MINFGFNIRVPGSNRFQQIKNWHGSTPFTFKYWELEIYKSADIVDLSFEITTKQSHAGFRLNFALLGYNIGFNFYDSRHWNYFKKTWEHYDEHEDIL